MEKIELRKQEDKFIVYLGSYGYLLLEPLAKTNDDTMFSVTFKVNEAVCVSSQSMFYTNAPFEKLLKHELQMSICGLIESLQNIQKEL